MGAFFSGTDNNDDQHSYCYSGVVGHLDKPSPALVFRLNIADEKFTIEAGEIFDFTIPLPEVPAEWLDKVSVQTYAAAYGGYDGLGGWGRGYRGSNIQTYRGGKEVGNANQKKGNGGANTAADSRYDVSLLAPIEPGKLSADETSALVAILGKKTCTELGIGVPPEPAAAEVNVDLPSADEFEDLWLAAYMGGDQEALGILEGMMTEAAALEEVGPAFTDKVKHALQLTELTTDQYPTLRTVAIYEYIVDQLSGLYEAAVDERGQKYVIETQNRGKDGIRVLARAFVQDHPTLREYSAMHAIEANFTADKFAGDVWELIHDLGAGVTY